VTGGNTFDTSANYWDRVLVYWFVKTKEKIEEEVYKTPIEKATSLLNTLEQKELWQKEK
jgi:hypothetical protein